jgi:hypothetical protein
MKKLLVNVGATILGVLMMILMPVYLMIAIPLLIMADTMECIMAVRKGDKARLLIHDAQVELLQFICDCVEPIMLVKRVWKS